MAVYYCNLNFAEAENARLGYIAFLGQPGIHSETLPQKISK